MATDYWLVKGTAPGKKPVEYHPTTEKEALFYFQGLNLVPGASRALWHNGIQLLKETNYA